MAKAAASKAASLVSKGAIARSMLGIAGMTGLLVSTVGPLRLPFAETLAKTYYREAVVGLLLAVAVVTALITAVVKLFDPNQFKDQIVRYVHERTQRELVLEGDLTMRYFPKLGIESGKASLSQRRSAREFAAIDKARVTLAWLPLLRGRMHVDSVEVDGLRAQLMRFKDGSTNVDDLAHDIASIAPTSVDVESLRLDSATLQWNDEVAWQRGSINDLHIEVGRLSDGLPSPLVASARIDAPGAGVDAKLRLKGRLMFDAASGRVELARIDAQIEGKALGIDNLSLNAKGDVTAWPGQRSLNADNVVLTSMHKSGLSVFNIVIAAPELKLGEYRLSGSALSVDASMTHPARTATLALKVPRFEWAERALRDATAQAQVTLRNADGKVSAQLSSPLLLALDAGPRLELSALEMNASASHPALAAEVAAKFAGKLEVDWKQQAARAELSGQLAGHDAKAEITLADFGRPRWSVDVDAVRLDLDALLSSTWIAHWNDDATPFDVSALRDVNAKGGVRIAQLKLAGLQMNAASARFELDRSALALEPITAQAYGAQLEATLQVDANAAPRISAKGSLNEADLRKLLADVAREPWLEGRGALTWDLSSDGGSVGTLRHALAGSMNISARGGTLAGVDLRAALLEGRPEFGKRAPAQAREFNAGARTPFNDMKARIEFRAGRANGQVLELNAAALRASGEGELVLDSGALDLKLQATVSKGVPELANLIGVSVPLQVQGPWRQPRFAFDYGAATGPGVPRAADLAEAPAVPLAMVKETTGAAAEHKPGAVTASKQ